MIKWIDSLNESLLTAAEWTGKNFKFVAGTLAVLLVVGAVWAGVSYSHDTRSAKAMIGYDPIEKDFTTWKNPEPVVAPGDKKLAPALPAAQVDGAELFGRMLEFIKKEGDVPASQMTALMAADVAQRLGPAQEADLLELSKKTFRNGSILTTGLVLLKKGDLLANQDKCDQALDQWKEVISNKRLSYVHDLARLKSGLCFEKMSKFKEAEDSYNFVIQAGEKAKNDKQKTAQNVRQNQWALKEAQKLKRALKWSQKQPSS